MTIVSCPNCLSRFKVKTEGERAANFIKCAACAHIFVVTAEMLSVGTSGPKEQTSEFLPELSFIEPPSESAKAPQEPQEFTALGTSAAPAVDEARKKGKQAVLVVAAKDEVLPVTKFQTTFGRRNADVTLDDPDVSRQHAVIERYDEKFLLKDLESTNGTYLNGQRVTIDFLKDGDVIRMGKTVVRFQIR